MRSSAIRALAAIFTLFSILISRAEPPKLVLTIIVDQMRYDYLERSPHLFAPNGFRLLLERGAFMTSAKYNYFPTVTGPGHASYLSGSGPAVHGIIGNDWFDKKTGKDIYCCADTNVTAVGTTNKSAMSPRNFLGATVADQMRLDFNSKVIGLSIKDRGAILPAGKKPAGAFWFDAKTARFITSTYYMTNLPAWVTEFNDRKIPQSYAGKVWDRLFDEKEYLFTDKSKGEGKLHKETNSIFPHTITFASTNSTNVTANATNVTTTVTNYESVLKSPFGDEIMTQFAIAALDAEQLGQGSTPDMLCLSYSSCDTVGHEFGPYSHETQDLIYRQDRQFEKLFNHIDQKIGLANVIIVLTADHAVAPLPEFANLMGLDGNRFNAGKYATNLQTRLEEKFGAGKYFRKTNFSNGGLFLNHETLQQKALAPAAVASFLREEALASGNFQAVFTREQLLDGSAHGWIGQCVLNGYNAERGADLMMLEKPFSISSTSKTGTTHGSVYSYDTRVPVIFFGRPFKPGRYADEFYITDIAPTLSSALKITEPPGSIGKVAVKILVDQ